MPEFATAFLIFFGLLLGLIASGLWLFAAIYLVGIASLTLYMGFPLDRVGLLLQATTWNAARAWELSSIPLFIWMGDLLIRTNIATALFNAVAPWTRHIPGGLIHFNVIGSTLFAAVSGSTAATTATIGKITVPELLRLKYPRALSLGSIAGAGSIGILIPPSIPLIVYGVLAEASISDLFMAGFLPGLLLASLFFAYIAVVSLISGRTGAAAGAPAVAVSWRASLMEILPFAAIIVLIIGGIYSGFATPSESAALGVTATLLLVLLRGQLTFGLLRETLRSAVRTSCMIGILLIASSFLSSAMSMMHIPQEAGQLIALLQLSPYELIFVLTIFYILLGCVLDGTSMMVMTLPITLPMVVGAGFDPIWLGIYFVLTMELGLITPPIGFNLFVIKGITGEPIGRIALAAMPFFFLMLLAILLITVFPDIVLVLPRVL